MFDCILFDGEYEALELRLYELAELVECTFIVEGNLTFRGEPKLSRWCPASFPEFCIEHVVVDLTNLSSCSCCVGVPFSDQPPWRREAHQRNGVLERIRRETGYVIVTDADEVPRRSAVEQIVDNYSEPVRLYLHNYAYSFHWMSPGWCPAGFVARIEDIDNCQRLRHETQKAWYDAGWHLSSFGGVEAVQRKFRSYAHTEYDKPEFTNDEYLRWCIETGNSPWGQYAYVENPDVPLGVYRVRDSNPRPPG